MTDLVSDANQQTQSPKRKFSFRFPNLSHGQHSHDKDMSPLSNSNNSNSNTLNSSAYKERRNFSEEVQNVPDLQVRLHIKFPLLYLFKNHNLIIIYIVYRIRAHFVTKSFLPFILFISNIIC